MYKYVYEIIYITIKENVYCPVFSIPQIPLDPKIFDPLSLTLELGK